MPENAEIGSLSVPTEHGVAHLAVSAQANQVTLRATLLGISQSTVIDRHAAYNLAQFLAAASIEAGLLTRQPANNGPGGGE